MGSKIGLVGSDYYWVKKNDNLSKIAKRFDTDVIHLTSLNKMRDPDSLFPGQKLRISNKVPGSAKTKKKYHIKNAKRSFDQSILVNAKVKGAKNIHIDRPVSKETLKGIYKIGAFLMEISFNLITQITICKGF